MAAMSNELFRALQLIAAKATVSPDWEDWYRRTCRWYSKQFSTPLTEVYKLSEEEIIRTYFEEIYQELSQRSDDEGKAHWEAVLEDVITTEEQKKIIADAEKVADEDDDDWYKEELARLKDAETKKDESLQGDGVEYTDEDGFKVKPNLMGELPDHIFAKGEEHLAEYSVDHDESVKYDEDDES